MVILMDSLSEQITELQKKLQDRRLILHKTRLEMDEIEAELIPLQNRQSAIGKMKRAGLSEAEVKALQ
jgi:hypothetical protein